MKVSALDFYYTEENNKFYIYMFIGTEDGKIWRYKYHSNDTYSKYEIDTNNKEDKR